MLKGGNSSVGVSILFAIVLALAPAAPVVAETLPVPPDVLITEIQTGNDTAGQEFIELYNSTDTEIDLADTDGSKKQTWKLQFFSGAKVSASTFAWATTSPTSTISLTGKIAPHEYYLLSTTDYLPASTDPDQTYSARMANDAGGVRLVTVGTVSKIITGKDHLGWLASLPVGATWLDFVHVHTAHGSWQRELNEEGTYQDETNQVVALIDTTDITPKTAWQTTPEPPPVGEPDPVDETPPVDDPEQVLPTTEEAATESPVPESVVPQLLAPQITELLPNPASPATDDADEYVELYNPNSVSFDLMGFVLETGLTNSYHVSLDGVVIPALSYMTVTSGSSTLSLANSGGHARLLDSNSAVVSQSDDYEDAPEGESWAFINDAWQWTITPTSALANVLTLAPPPAPKPTTKKTATAKPKTVSKPKPKVLTASTTKKASTKTPVNVAAAQPYDEEEVSPPSVHAGILAAAGVLAVAYAGYEYRQDVANRFHQLRRYRAARRAARTSSQGR